MKYVADGDVGCGVPGDPHWHRCVVMQLDVDDIAEYMLKACGIEIDTDGDVRKAALEVIDDNGA